MASFIYSQGIAFLAFFLLGIGIAALFDLFRMIRRIFPHHSLAVKLEDFCFCMLSGIAIGIALFYFQTGKLRIFLPISIFSGIALWNISLGRFIMGPFLQLLIRIRNKLSHLRKN